MNCKPAGQNPATPATVKSWPNSGRHRGAHLSWVSEAVHAYRSQAVAAQASGLLQRYRQTRDLADLHAAIRLLRESVTAAPRTRIYYAQRLNDLGNSLAIWAERACLSAPAYCAPFPARAGTEAVVQLRRT
jgi:hypothetical protein